jgi:hypothetical protein
MSSGNVRGVSYVLPQAFEIRSGRSVSVKESFFDTAIGSADKLATAETSKRKLLGGIDGRFGIKY